MPKLGRNDPCPCGSGKKYKQCCLNQDHAAATVARLEAQRVEQETAQRKRRAIELAQVAAYQESVALDQASNAVVDMISTGRLDQAEQVARQLLVDYPQVHDGHDRLGMVYEARGLNKEAADCYRKAVDFIRAHADYYDSDMVDMYLKLIAKLDPPTAP